MQFHEIISRWPGGTHEKQIYNISETRQRLQRLQMSATCNEAYLLASSRFDGCSFLRTPILNPQDENDEQYNTCHGQTYALLDSAIRLWKERFPRLQTIFKNHEGRKTNDVFIDMYSFRFQIVFSPLLRPQQYCTTLPFNTKCIFNVLLIPHYQWMPQKYQIKKPINKTKTSHCIYI